MCPGALPPLASLTIVRVTNFTVYQKCKHAISDFVERQTGTSPLAVYNTPGSLPTFTGVSCFMASGMLAGLCAAPIACAFILPHKYLLIRCNCDNNKQQVPSNSPKTWFRRLFSWQAASVDRRERASSIPLFKTFHVYRLSRPSNKSFLDMASAVSTPEWAFTLHETQLAPGSILPFMKHQSN